MGVEKAKAGAGIVIEKRDQKVGSCWMDECQGREKTSRRVPKQRGREEERMWRKEEGGKKREDQEPKGQRRISLDHRQIPSRPERGGGWRIGRHSRDWEKREKSCTPSAFGEVVRRKERGGELCQITRHDPILKDESPSCFRSVSHATSILLLSFPRPLKRELDSDLVTGIEGKGGVFEKGSKREEEWFGFHLPQSQGGREKGCIENDPRFEL